MRASIRYHATGLSLACLMLNSSMPAALAQMQITPSRTDTQQRQTMPSDTSTQHQLQTTPSGTSTYQQTQTTPSGTGVYQQTQTTPSGTSVYRQTQTTSPTGMRLSQQTQSYTIPAGTRLTVREMGAAFNNGQAFAGQLVNPVRVNGMILLPSGSTLQGEVISVDPNTGMRHIQLRSVSLQTGSAIAFEAPGVTNTPAGVVAVREEPITGRVTAGPQGAAGYVNTIYPRVSIGPETVNPAAKVLAGTVAGAAFGAATGTLTGLTMAAVYDDDMDMGEGTAAARGLAWGSVYGAGFGLLSGLIAAATTTPPVGVASVQNVPPTPAGLTYEITLNAPVTVCVQ